LQQARQNAARAEQTAQALAAKAADAQQVAARADESARSLYVQSEQASSVAGQARQGLAMIRSASEMQNSLSNTVSQVSVRQEVKVTDTQTSPVESPPVVNTSGQVTGVVVNTTA
jgi:hypothetical protein